MIFKFIALLLGSINKKQQFDFFGKYCHDFINNTIN